MTDNPQYRIRQGRHLYDFSALRDELPDGELTEDAAARLAHYAGLIDTAEQRLLAAYGGALGWSNLFHDTVIVHGLDDPSFDTGLGIDGAMLLAPYLSDAVFDWIICHEGAHLIDQQWNEEFQLLEGEIGEAFRTLSWLRTPTQSYGAWLAAIQQKYGNGGSVIDIVEILSVALAPVRAWAATYGDVPTETLLEARFDPEHPQAAAAAAISECVRETASVLRTGDAAMALQSLAELKARAETIGEEGKHAISPTLWRINQQMVDRIAAIKPLDDAIEALRNLGREHHYVGELAADAIAMIHATEPRVATAPLGALRAHTNEMIRNGCPPKNKRYTFFSHPTDMTRQSTLDRLAPLVEQAREAGNAPTPGEYITRAHADEAMHREQARKQRREQTEAGMQPHQGA